MGIVKEERRSRLKRKKLKVEEEPDWKKEEKIKAEEGDWKRRSGDKEKRQ